MFGDKIKNNLQTRIFLALVIIIFIVISTVYINYTLYKKDYEDFTSYSINNTISKIKHDIIKADNVINTTIKMKYTLFQDIHKYALNRLKQNSELDLNQLKKELDAKFPAKLIKTELYLINSDYIIYDTTYKKDLNLDMSKFLGAREYIDQARGNIKKVSIANPSLDVLNKRYMIYSYALLDDKKKIVLEMGFFDKMSSDLKNSLYSFHINDPLMQEVELFSDYGKYIINITKHKKIKNISKQEFLEQRISNDDKELNIVKEVSKTNETYSYDIEENNKNYRISYTKISSEYISKSKIKSHILKTKLDITKFNDKLIKLKFYLYLTIFISLLFIIGCYIFLIKYFMHPVSIILESIQSWERIDDQKLLNSENEFSQIAQSFNQTFDEQIKKAKEIKDNENILIHQSRLASMGEMIGNIAHQWRQPLNILGIKLMTLDTYYKQDLVNQKFIDEYIKSSTNTLQHMSDTIDDFRDFFKPDKEKEIFNICNAIETSIGVVSDSFKKHNITHVLNCEDDIDIDGYKNEFSQVILNLITNSKDALKQNNIEDGKITINISLLKDYVSIKVKDNAGGIPEDIINKVFEPYFTTKHQSQGTGIGLYMSKMIIEKNIGGELKVENDKDGAVFTIELKNKEIK